MKLKALLASLLMSSVLAGCSELAAESENIESGQYVRGLKAITIEQPTNVMYRNYPSVLKAAEQSVLSFEIAGKLAKNNLEVGKKFSRGDVLAELDKTSLLLSVEQAKAAFEQANVSLTNANKELQRYTALLKQKIVTKADFDRVKTQADVANAQQIQAEKQLESAQETLAKAKLIAPYDGVVTSLKKDSFITVQPGEEIATVYNPQSVEARISVPYEVVTHLSVGQDVQVRLADNSSVVLPAVITELASSAEVASTYPVYVRIDEMAKALKVGMAVEVILSFYIEQSQSFKIPFQAILSDQGMTLEDTTQTAIVDIFLYQPESSTVKRQQVEIMGVVDNFVLVSKGLKPGDIVAVAGVSFLKDGQQVKLLTDSK